MSVIQILADASRHIAGGAYEEADRLCRLAIEREPSNGRPWNLLGEIAHRLGLDDIATELASHAAKLSAVESARSPEEQDMQAGSAPVGAATDDNDEFVIDRYLATLDSQPANIRARTKLAGFLLRLGRADEATIHAFAGLAYGADDAELATLVFRLLFGPLADRPLPCEICIPQGSLKLPRHPKLYRFMEQARSQLAANDGRQGPERFAKYARRLDLDIFDIACLGIFWRQTARLSSLDALPSCACPLSLSHFAKVLRSKELASDGKELFLQGIGYDTKSPRELNRVLFEDYVVPTIAEAAKYGEYALVTYLDQANFYFGFAQQPYTEAQWDHCSSQIRRSLECAAAELAQAHARPICWPTLPRPVVGFTTQWAFKGISADNLLERTIEGILASEPRPFDPVLYVVQGSHEPAHVNAVRARGIPVVIVDDPGGDGDPFLRTMLALRQRMALDQVSALVLMGVTESMATLAGALRLAPAQIFFTVGFRQVKLPAYWHGYFAAFSLFKHAELHNDRLWRAGPAYLPSLLPDGNSAEMQKVVEAAAQLRRARFGDKLILSAICRPIKIQNAAYMDVLARILKQNAHCAFLWTSPVADAAAVQRMMNERGIAPQCERLDWMDPRVLGQLTDIHLDPFPFPNGHSMLETMYAGKPFVWLDNDVTRDGHCSCGVIMPVLEGKVGTVEEQQALKAIFTDAKTQASLAPAAKTVDEYVEQVQRMIDDEAYRAAVGKAGRTFVTHFYGDKANSVRAFSEHCLEIIAEAQRCDAPLASVQENAPT
jgi:hypothetical protein